MATIYSVKYPIELPIVGRYTISQGGSIIYTGYSYKPPINIAPILQDYLNAELLNVTSEDLPNTQANSTIQSFSVYSEENGMTYTIMAAYDYNNEYRQFINGNNILSYSVTNKYSPYQLIFIDNYSENSDSIIKIGNNITISGNYSDNIIVGVDGIKKLSLTQSGTTTTTGLNAITYGNGIFVAVGVMGRYARSTDGINWTSGLTGTGLQLFGVAYGNGIFLAVGESGSYARSADGINWTTGTIGTIMYQLRKVIFNNNLFVFGGSSSIVGYTSDGISYSYTANAAGLTQTIRGIAYGYGEYIFAAANGRIIKTNDLVNFTSTQTTPVIALYAATFGNGVFIVAGNNGQTFRSTNGVDWEYIESGSTGTVTDGIYANNNHLFISTNGNYFISTNGVGYDIGSTQSTPTGITYAQDKYVGVGNNGNYFILELTTEPTTITINGDELEINITDGCEEYAIYFINREGGRCSFLQPKSIKTVKRNTMNWNRFKGNYDMLDSASFENKTIAVGSVYEYQFNTGWLTDEQYLLLEPIFDSPKIWIHDLVNNVIHSAQINMTQTQIQNFKNNKAGNTTLNIIESQTQLRR